MRKLNSRLAGYTILVLVIAGVALMLLHWLNAGRVADALLFQARKAEKQGRQEAAIQLWNQYLDYRPHDTDARAELARALSDRDRSPTRKSLQRAYFHLERVLTQDSNRDDVRRRLVGVAIDLDRFDTAEAQLNILLAKHPEDAGVALLKARYHEAREEFELAVSACRQAIRLAPDRLDSYERLARLLRTYGRSSVDSIAEADACIEAMVAANPTSARARIAMCRYLMEHGAADDPSRLRQALEHVKRAEEIAPNDADVLLVGWETALAFGELDQARSRAATGIRLYPKDRRFHQAKATLDATVGDSITAMRELRAALPLLAPMDQPEVLFDLAELLIDAGDIAGAEAIVTRLHEARAPSLMIDFIQGRIEFSQSRWADAAVHLEHVAVANSAPRLAKRANRFLVDCYSRLDDATGHLAAWKRIVAREPASVTARMRLAAAFLQLDWTDEAIAEYRHIIDLPRPPADAWSDLLRLLIAKGDISGAEQVMQSAATALIPFTDMALMRAEVLMARNEWNAAYDLLSEARTRFPDDVHVRLAQAALAERQDQPAVARRILEEAEHALGDSSLLRVAYIQLLEKHRGADVKSDLDRLGANLDAFPREVRARLLAALATAWTKLGDLEKAERAWDELAQQSDHENRISIRRRLFELALERGDVTTIQRRLDDVERAEGGLGPIWRLCEIERLVRLARQGNMESLTSSREMAEKLNAERPDWGAVSAARGEIEELAGNLDLSNLLYRQAITLGERRDWIVNRLLVKLRQQNRAAELDEMLRILGKPTAVGAAMSQRPDL